MSIKNGQLRIVNEDGRAHSTKIITSNGEELIARSVQINIIPGKPITATIVVRIDSCDIEIDGHQVKIEESNYVST